MVALYTTGMFAIEQKLSLLFGLNFISLHTTVQTLNNSYPRDSTKAAVVGW